LDETTLANMRLRIERCRRLARTCTDDDTAKALLQMADDGEADIARMLTDCSARETAQSGIKILHADIGTAQTF